VKGLFTFIFLFVFALFPQGISSAQKITAAQLDQELSKVNSIPERVDILNQKADAFLNDAGFEEALLCLNKAQQLLKNQNLPEKSITTYQNLGNVHSDMGKNYEALHDYNQALDLSKKIGLKKEIARSLNLIGLIYQIQGDYPDALKVHHEALAINTSINERQGILKNSLNIASTYLMQGNYELALTSFKHVLKIAREMKDESYVSKCLNNISVCYYQLGNYPESLVYLLQALKMNEGSGNKKLMAENYRNMGLIFFHQENYKDALKYQMLSLKLNRDLGLVSETAGNYTNLYQIYEKLNKSDLAMEFENKALKLNLESGNQSELSKNYRNIAYLYFRKNQAEKAIEHYSYALAIDKRLNDPEGISLSGSNLAQVYTQLGRYQEARKLLDECGSLVLKTGNKNTIKEYYKIMMKLDSVQSNWKSAFMNHYFFNLYKDSLLNESNTRKLVQSQMQYEFDKQQDADRLRQATKDAIAVQEKKRQRLITYVIALVLLFVIIFSVLLYNRFRITVKQKKIIESQKQRVEIQKGLIEEKNQQVTDSINYARKIQTAILPPLALFHQRLPQSFVLYLPKDIVAGDFYWQQVVNEEVLFAACDCTGHGVPGAMVSVVCSNALNRALREFNHTRPNDILDSTLQIVVDNFSSTEGELKDGMDIALCTYNPRTRILQYSGANNPLWVIRNKELTEIKADKQCIGYNYHTKPFTLHEIQLQPEDMVYLSSDGFADQFGGEDGRKKITKKRFKELLVEMSEMPVKAQSSALFDYFNRYRGQHEQIDDVLVLGFRV
jgi:tetratricopeptide (TPR) repeat protein